MATEALSLITSEMMEPMKNRIMHMPMPLSPKGPAISMKKLAMMSPAPDSDMPLEMPSEPATTMMVLQLTLCMAFFSLMQPVSMTMTAPATQTGP